MRTVVMAALIGHLGQYVAIFAFYFVTIFAVFFQSSKILVLAKLRQIFLKSLTNIYL